VLIAKQSDVDLLIVFNRAKLSISLAILMGQLKVQTQRKNS
jgi:hypothetical protein